MPTGVYPRRPLSEETKRRIGIANTGKTRTQEQINRLSDAHQTEKAIQSSCNNLKAAIASNTGRSPSLAARANIQLALKKLYQDPILRLQNSLRQRGAKASNWRGGVSDPNRLLRCSSRFREWRCAVFIRDSWTCQLCGYKGKNLHPHHILPFATYHDLRFEVENGITLCSDCHQSVHKCIKLSEV